MKVNKEGYWAILVFNSQSVIKRFNTFKERHDYILDVLVYKNSDDNWVDCLFEGRLEWISDSSALNRKFKNGAK